MVNETIWQEFGSYYGACLTLKENPSLPDYVEKITYYTSYYEGLLRELWEKFKQNPTVQAAKDLIKFIKEVAGSVWREAMEKILGVSDLSQRQEDLLQEQLDEHFSFLDTSFLPDLVKGIEDLIENFNIFDWRLIVMYSGALWSFGFLTTIMFDGLDIRDLADLFIFIGPIDEDNCKGPRNCRQHVNKIYTVAEILVNDIIPGRLACYTNCRHILIPIASPLKEEEN